MHLHDFANSQPSAVSPVTRRKSFQLVERIRPKNGVAFILWLKRPRMLVCPAITSRDSEGLREARNVAARVAWL